MFYTIKESIDVTHFDSQTHVYGLSVCFTCLNINYKKIYFKIVAYSVPYTKL